MTRQRIAELLLSAWHWLPVRGKVLVTILALAQLYWVRWFFAYYVRAPAALYRARDVERDTTRTLDPRYPEPIDLQLLRFLEHGELKLGALGFRDPHRTTNQTTYPLTLAGSSMEHAERGDHVLVVGWRPPHDHLGDQPAGSVAFDSEFEDGMRLVTSNVRALRYWPDPHHTDHVRLPDVTDIDELYRLHRLRVDRRSAGVPQKKITRGKTPEQRLVFTKRRHLELHKHLVRCGYRRRTAGGVRPTIRGAVFSAWRHVFPWRTIDQWWLRRRARAVMRLA